MRKTTFSRVCRLILWLTPVLAARAELHRGLPAPLTNHPGNIFLAGENIVLDPPPGDVETWRAVDYDGKVAAKGRLKDGKVELGALPVGWYKIVRGMGHVTNRVFIGVLEPLKAPTPITSPICIDVAMAWFFSGEKMKEVANLCTLAGINRVRDRLMWDHMEPKRGEFSRPNQYDASAQVQSEAGLQILQVSHVSASWASPNPKRFPTDLRDIYNFNKEMARRWKGKVGAFEPWNEADIIEFGGHTGSEMATLQKAAYLGLKAGNPDIIACQNVFAIRRATTLNDFAQNETWACFDTYNLHHYESLQNYPSLYADQRAVSAGKPIWVSECSVHVRWKGDENLKELSDDDLRLQSERLTKTYALAIHEGAEAVFYFVLPHYTEGKLQYGLLRGDLTPRPGFVALAAAGRLFADARPVGQLKSSDENLQGYLYTSKPQGQETDLLVIWSEKPSNFELPRKPLACFDHLGRPRLISGNVLYLERAPLYVLLPEHSRPPFSPPPSHPALLAGRPGEVVFQALLPEKSIILEKSAYKIHAGEKIRVPLFVYNFGAKTLLGHLSARASCDWKMELPQTLEIAPGERKEMGLFISPSAASSDLSATIQISGDFQDGNKPLLSMQFICTNE